MLFYYAVFFIYLTVLKSYYIYLTYVENHLQQHIKIVILKESFKSQHSGLYFQWERM